MRPESKALLTQWRTTPVTVDWNKDGLVDLVMLDQEGYLAFFERAVRDGRRILLHPKRVFCDEKEAPLQFNKKPGGGSGRRKLCVVDWNGDGKLDILINSKNAELWQQTEAKREPSNGPTPWLPLKTGKSRHDERSCFSGWCRCPSKCRLAGARC